MWRCCVVRCPSGEQKAQEKVGMVLRQFNDRLGKTGTRPTETGGAGQRETEVVQDSGASWIR